MPLFHYISNENYTADCNYNECYTASNSNLIPLIYKTVKYLYIKHEHRMRNHTTLLDNMQSKILLCYKHRSIL